MNSCDHGIINNLNLCVGNNVTLPSPATIVSYNKKVILTNPYVHNNSLPLMKSFDNTYYCIGYNNSLGSVKMDKFGTLSCTIFNK
jgi:hypothetical protein